MTLSQLNLLTTNAPQWQRPSEASSVCLSRWVLALKLDNLVSGNGTTGLELLSSHQDNHLNDLRKRTSCLRTGLRSSTQLWLSVLMLVSISNNNKRLLVNPRLIFFIQFDPVSTTYSSWKCWIDFLFLQDLVQRYIKKWHLRQIYREGA